MEKKEIYRICALKEKNTQQTLLLLLAALAVCGFVFFAAQFLPASWFFELSAIIAVSVYINKLMKKGTFRTIYILYEDSLAVLTRYGLIEKVTAQYPVQETVFTETEIIYNGKHYPFYPDDKLKKLLNI